MEDELSHQKETIFFNQQEVLQNYQLGKIIGTGSFSKVRFARHLPTGLQVAIKILDRRAIRPVDAERAKREIKILKFIVHPHVIRLYEVIETRTETYIVLEYMRGGDLFDYITKKGYVREDEGSHLFQQIISGVDFCHRKKVVHRDLKPDNILLDSYKNAKVADFGLGNIMRDGHFLQTSCGSMDYAAPEIICGQLYAGPEVDVWSCGVTLYTILCGKLPFEADNIFALKSKLKSEKFDIPWHLSPLARDLLSKILVVDPTQRITIPEILRHPWLQHNRLPSQITVPACPLNKVSTSSVSPKSNNCGTKSLENCNYRQQTARGSNWAPGFQFQAKPGEIMNATLRTLNSMNVCWKSIGNYNMKCRWLPQFPNPKKPVNDVSPFKQLLLPNPVSSTEGGADGTPPYKNTVKFEMQLYKARDNTYLLDLQRLHGSPFIFLEICLAFRDRIQLV